MAKSKRKVTMPAGIRNKLMAAGSMLMISAIMMVSSTYAWFTLSTAPEVKNISTTVAGNGSLEIALMPESGKLEDITNGISSESTVDNALKLSNKSWGNIVQLDDTYYGLGTIALNPAVLNVIVPEGNTVAQLADPTSPLTTAKYGYDGRVDTADEKTIVKALYDNIGTQLSSFSGDAYGVRAVGGESKATIDSGDGTSTEVSTISTGETYGYVIDLAFRLNTFGENGNPGSLLLQTTPQQRIYDGTSANPDTLGGGSYMSFNNIDSFPETSMNKLMSAIRVTFVKDYGKSGTTTPVILGTAKLDVQTLAKDDTTKTTKAGLYLYQSTTGEGATATETKLENNQAVILPQLNKNAMTQISAIVWLDGSVVDNASVLASTAVLQKSTLNLQFSTNVELAPAENNALMQGDAE